MIILIDKGVDWYHLSGKVPKTGINCIGDIKLQKTMHMNLKICGMHVRLNITFITTPLNSVV